MKVRILATGEVVWLNPSYANRMIEQGKAGLAPAKPTKAEPEKKTKAKKTGKGD